jgi:cytochrome c556
MQVRWLAVGLAVSLALGLLWEVRDVSAQRTKGKTRPAATKYLMRGINLVHCKGLGELLKGSGPADDKAWDKAACHASCLNEMSYLLMEDGRCPDATWAGAAAKLREGSAAALQAIEKKDLNSAQAAFQTITQACATCHKAHKH